YFFIHVLCVYSVFDHRPLFSSIYTILFFFFFNDPAPTEIYTLSLHDALPICPSAGCCAPTRSAPARLSDTRSAARLRGSPAPTRSEEHTSELQSQSNLVCRLLLEKKKKQKKNQRKQSQ